MDPIPPIPEPPAGPPPPPATLLVGRLMNVFAAPGEVFSEIKTAPPAVANWLVPALLFVVLSWLSAAVIFSQPAIRQQITDLSNRAIDQQVEKGKISAAQADKIRESSEKFGRVGYEIGAAVEPVFTMGFSLFLGGLVLWLVGTFALKGSFPYMKAVEVAGLSCMTLVLEVVIKTLLILITGNLFASPSLALLVRDFDPQNTVHALLAMVNVMVFWLLIIRAVGLARLSGASVTKAAVWVFGIWIVFMGLMIGMGAALRTISGG